MTYKIICGCCPTYLSILAILQEMFTTSDLPPPTLQPRSRSEHYGDRSFSYAVPHLWNSLPDLIRNSESVDIYKNALKLAYSHRTFSNNCFQYLYRVRFVYSDCKRFDTFCVKRTNAVLLLLLLLSR